MTMKGTKGSVILASMLIAIIVALLCGSYAALVLTEYRGSVQSNKYNSAINLAEAGVEEAMWALNKKSLNDSFGWVIDSANNKASKLIGFSSTIDLGQGDLGLIRIRIDGYSGGSPVIISEGLVTHLDMPTVSKQIKVTLEASSGGLKGLTIKNNVIFNNRPMIDSYDSQLGPYQGDPSKSGYNRNDQGSIIAIDGGIQLNDAQVYGTVGVGSSSISAVQAPMNGGYLRNSSSAYGVSFDTSLITTGVTMDWPSTPVPPAITTTSGSYLSVTANTTTTLGNSAASSPQYYYYRDNGGTLSLNGTTVLDVVGPVVLILERGLQMNNSGEIRIAANASASLKIYASENINISGKGINNLSTSADKLTIYGCGGGGQNISLGSNTTTTGVFYAPTWNINFNGGASWCGAVLAQYANFSNNNGLHYDERLKFGGTSGGKLTIKEWIELRDPASLAGNSRYAKDQAPPFNTRP